MEPRFRRLSYMGSNRARARKAAISHNAENTTVNTHAEKDLGEATIETTEEPKKQPAKPPKRNWFSNKPDEDTD